MNTVQPHSQAASSGEWELLKVAAIIIGVLAVGPVTIAVAVGLAGLFQRWRRRWLWLLALPCAGGSLLVWPMIRVHLQAALKSVHGHVLARPTTALEVAWPHLWPAWIATLLISPIIALVITYRQEPAVGAASEDQDRRQAERIERRMANKAATVTDTPLDKAGVFLGYPLGGDPLLPTRRGRVYLPLPRLSHHLLVAGATGSGKTETVLRLADSVANATDWNIVYIDGKGDRRTKERFTLLMENAGRTVSLFPDQPHNGWQGDPDEIAGRLLQLIDFAQEGGGTFYRDLAVNTVRLACVTPTGPPRSSTEFMRRINRDALLDLHPAHSPAWVEINGLSREQLDGIRARYAAFFGLLADSLDGTSTFDDTDTSYYLLDGLRLKHEAGYLARFLVEEFTQWAVARKPIEQNVLLIVDEFSAIAQAGQGLVDVVERARGFGVAAVLCPQVAEGMGSPEAAARIIGSAQTILLHAMATPEQFVRAAGTRRYQHTTRQLQGDNYTGLGSTRNDDEYRADPNAVRRLRTGQCYAIGSGRAMKLQIAPAPSLATLRTGARPRV